MGTGAENNEREGSTKHQHESRVERASASLSWTGIVCCSDFAVCEICRGVRGMLVKYIIGTSGSPKLSPRNPRNLRRSNGSGKNKTKAACRARRRERKGPGRFTSSPSTSIAGRAMNLAAKPVRACSRASSVTGLMLRYETRINSLNKSWRNPWCRRQKFVVRLVAKSLNSRP